MVFLVINMILRHQADLLDSSIYDTSRRSHDVHFALQIQINFKILVLKYKHSKNCSFVFENLTKQYTYSICWRLLVKKWEFPEFVQKPTYILPLFLKLTPQAVPNGFNQNDMTKQ